MERITQKYSTILIASGKETKVYRSVHEVPLGLRKKLVETTSGRNAATLLIADENGRQEILKSLKGLPSAVQTHWLRSILNASARPSPALTILRNWRQIAEFAVLGAIGLLLWLLTSHRA